MIKTTGGDNFGDMILVTPVEPVIGYVGINLYGVVVDDHISGCDFKKDRAVVAVFNLIKNICIL